MILNGYHWQHWRKNMANTKSYEALGWVSNKWLVGKTITFTYDNLDVTSTVYVKTRNGREQSGAVQFNINGRKVCRCPFKLLSGIGLEDGRKMCGVLYHPERDIYALARDICLVTGNIIENKIYFVGEKCYFYDEDAMIAYMKAGSLVKSNNKAGKKSIGTSKLAREIYNSKDKDGNYRCHVSGEVMDLKGLNADHCHCTGRYVGLVTPEVNVIEGQLKKLLSLKGLELTHEERLDLIRGMLQGAEKMHNKRLMEIWENTVTSREQKKTSTQQSTPMQLSLAL